MLLYDNSVKHLVNINANFRENKMQNKLIGNTYCCNQSFMHDKPSLELALLLGLFRSVCLHPP